MVAERRITNKSMKYNNLEMVLNFIRRSEEITRGELAKKTGLTVASVTNLVNELHARGIIRFVGNGASAGGRKPELIRLSPDALYCCGLEMTYSHMQCAVGDLRGNLLAFREHAIEPKEGRAALLHEMESMINDSIEASGVPRKEISALGLAVPGPSDYKNGIILNPPNFPDWVNVPICNMMSERLGLRTYICKETSCDGLAEYWFGNVGNKERIFVFHVGLVGIGGGLIDRGHVFYANDRETMDIGHNVVQTEGFACSCGSRGCLEAQASGRAAVQYARDAAARYPQSALCGKENITPQDVIRSFEKQDPVGLYAIGKCAGYMGMALRNAVLMLAPNRIFCGGGFLDQCPGLFDLLSTSVRGMRYPDFSRVSMEHFTFGRKNGAMGALALAFEKTLENYFA